MTTKQEQFIKDAYNERLDFSVCSDVKRQIKKNFPELFKDRLEIGKWYKQGSKCVIYITKKMEDEDWYESYGLNIFGDWMTMNGQFIDDGMLMPATNQEVEKALIKEAKKRYKVPCKVKYLDGSSNDSLVGYNLDFVNGKLCSTLVNGKNSDVLFQDGKWAEIIEEPKYPEKVQELIDEYGIERLKDILGK